MPMPVCSGASAIASSPPRRRGGRPAVWGRGRRGGEGRYPETDTTCCVYNAPRRFRATRCASNYITVIWGRQGSTHIIVIFSGPDPHRAPEPLETAGRLRRE